MSATYPSQTKNLSDHLEELQSFAEEAGIKELSL